MFFIEGIANRNKCKAKKPAWVHRSMKFSLQSSMLLENRHLLGKELFKSIVTGISCLDFHFCTIAVMYFPIAGLAFMFKKCDALLFIMCLDLNVKPKASPKRVSPGGASITSNELLKTSHLYISSAAVSRSSNTEGPWVILKPLGLGQLNLLLQLLWFIPPGIYENGFYGIKKTCMKFHFCSIDFLSCTVHRVVNRDCGSILA